MPVLGAALELVQKAKGNYFAGMHGSAGRYTSICSYSWYVSNTGYHSIYTGIFFITFCELEVIQEAIS